ncbi:Anaphase-promoting complex subunit 11 RING-H2 finger [Fragilaria crotonensis]|nr:Anaphase-promoting complex subunit 11 RING-H2 finger [Fragilaria crotonensis]
MLESTFRDFGSRFLQSSNSEELRFNQFLGFVLWYVLLLVCCLIPIICAYRRNRWQSRMARAAHLRQMAAIGTLHLGDSIRNEVLSRQAREENERKIQLAITSTTMSVTSKCLLPKQDSQQIDREDSDIENINVDSEFAALQLTGDHPNANRPVPAACVICLCPYEVGDSVTFSSNQDCRHAFHTECISTWMAKEVKPLCPCCRQDFCETVAEQPSSVDGS